MTPTDLKQIGSLFDKKFDNIDKKFADIKADIAVINYKVDKNSKAITKINKNILKWKSEMFDSAEVFMKETKDQREFREVGGYQLASNTNRIGKLETKVFGSITGV